MGSNPWLWALPRSVAGRWLSRDALQAAALHSRADCYTHCGHLRKERRKGLEVTLESAVIYGSGPGISKRTPKKKKNVATSVGAAA